MKRHGVDIYTFIAGYVVLAIVAALGYAAQHQIAGLIWLALAYLWALFFVGWSIGFGLWVITEGWRRIGKSGVEALEELTQ